MSLPHNLTIERLDAAEAKICSEVGKLRWLASDYAKRCEALRQHFVSHRGDLSQLHVMLTVLSHKHQRVKSVKPEAEKSQHAREELSEDQITEELLKTFTKWMTRSDRKRETNLNTLKSSYSRVKTSVGSLLREVMRNDEDSTWDSREARVEPNSVNERRHHPGNPSKIRHALAATTRTKIAENNMDVDKVQPTKIKGSIEYHRVVEESRHWRREADCLQSELSKLRASCKLLISQNKVVNNNDTVALHASVEEWKLKCSQLQDEILANKQLKRKNKYNKEMSKHAEARKEALEEEVKRLRSRLEAACSEVSKLRPLADRCKSAEEEVQMLRIQVDPLQAKAKKLEHDKSSLETELAGLKHERKVNQWTASSEMEKLLISSEAREREALAEAERLRKELEGAQLKVNESSLAVSNRIKESIAGMEAEKRELLASTMSAETRAAASNARLEAEITSKERVSAWICYKVASRTLLANVWKRWSCFSRVSVAQKSALTRLLVRNVGQRKQQLKRAWEGLLHQVWRSRIAGLRKSIIEILRREKCMEKNSHGSVAKFHKVSCLLTWKVYTNRRIAFRKHLSRCFRICEKSIYGAGLNRLSLNTKLYRQKTGLNVRAEQMLKRQKRRISKKYLLIWQKNARVGAAIRNWWSRAASPLGNTVSGSLNYKNVSSIKVGGLYRKWMIRCHMQQRFSRWLSWALVRRRHRRLCLMQGLRRLNCVIKSNESICKQKRLHMWRNWSLSWKSLPTLCFHHIKESSACSLRLRWNQWRTVCRSESARTRLLQSCFSSMSRRTLLTAWSLWRSFDAKLAAHNQSFLIKQELIQGLISKIVKRVSLRGTQRDSFGRIALALSNWKCFVCKQRHTRQKLVAVFRIRLNVQQRAARQSLKASWHIWSRLDVSRQIEKACSDFKEILNDTRRKLASSKAENRSLSKQLSASKQELSIAEAKYEQILLNMETEKEDLHRNMENLKSHYETIQAEHKQKELVAIAAAVREEKKTSQKGIENIESKLRGMNVVCAEQSEKIVSLEDLLSCKEAKSRALAETVSTLTGRIEETKRSRDEDVARQQEMRTQEVSSLQKQLEIAEKRWIEEKLIIQEQAHSEQEKAEARLREARRELNDIVAVQKIKESEWLRKESSYNYEAKSSESQVADAQKLAENVKMDAEHEISMLKELIDERKKHHAMEIDRERVRHKEELSRETALRKTAESAALKATNQANLIKKESSASVSELQERLEASMRSYESKVEILESERDSLLLAERRKDAENKIVQARLQSQLSELTREKERAIQREKETSSILRDLQISLHEVSCSSSVGPDQTTDKIVPVAAPSKSSAPPLPSKPVPKSMNAGRLKLLKREMRARQSKMKNEHRAEKEEISLNQVTDKRVISSKIDKENEGDDDSCIDSDVSDDMDASNESVSVNSKKGVGNLVGKQISSHRNEAVEYLPGSAEASSYWISTSGESKFSLIEGQLSHSREAHVALSMQSKELEVSLAASKKRIKSQSASLRRAGRKIEAQRLKVMQLESTLQKKTSQIHELSAELASAVAENRRLSAAKVNLASRAKNEHSRAVLIVAELEQTKRTSMLLAEKLQTSAEHLNTLLKENAILRDERIDAEALQGKLRGTEHELEDTRTNLSTLRRFQHLALGIAKEASQSVGVEEEHTTLHHFDGIPEEGSTGMMTPSPPSE